MQKFFFLSLIISFSLFSTSCNQDDEEVPILITADFTANQLVVEEGGSIDFTDLSTGESNFLDLDLSKEENQQALPNKTLP